MHEQLHSNGGGIKNIPGIQIGFDPETQQVHFKHDPFFKTWDMLLGVLLMATKHCETQRQMAIMANVQAAQMEAAQAEAIRRQVIRGG